MSTLFEEWLGGETTLKEHPDPDVLMAEIRRSFWRAEAVDDLAIRGLTDVDDILLESYAEILWRASVASLAASHKEAQ